jgi:hypothetical protein
MSLVAPKSSPCLGFLTVTHSPELGLLGGYLVLNAAGRPLEFHCTAPVKATRAQEILYGPTLVPFLCGELIGQTLLTRSKLTPVVACTDCRAVLAAREFVPFPVVWVQGGDEPAGADSGPAFGPIFALATSQVAAATDHAEDERRLREAWPSQAEHMDLLEPFARIREALEEAQKTAKAA